MAGKKCAGCGANILRIATIKGRFMPADAIPYRIDGKRLLIFPDGIVARNHPRFEVGHQTHFASYPKAGEFRRRT